MKNESTEKIDLVKSNKRIGLFGILSENSPSKVFLAVLLGSMAGFAYSLIIPLVLMTVSQGGESRFLQPDSSSPFILFGQFEVSTPKMAVAFFTLCLIIITFRTISHSLLNRVAVNATIDLRKMLYQRITQLPIKDMERIGPSRILASLTTDVPQIIGGASIFPNIMLNISTLIGLLSFLLYLNVKVFLFIILAIIFGAITYQIPMILGQRYMLKARVCFDEILEGVRGLIYGAKELKLNEDKRHDFLKNELNNIEDTLSVNQKRGDTLIILGVTYGDLISFFVIGIIAYILSNHYLLSREILVGVIMVMFYITGPIAVIINSIGPIIQGAVSAKKLVDLLNDMPSEFEPVSVSGIEDYDAIKFRSVKFRHSGENNDDSEFVVGPIDLELRRGEVTFLVGGNGSGKTTLAKLLSQHYVPDEGIIEFGNTQVTDCNRDACRQGICSIYSDFHLFSRIMGSNNSTLDELASKYLIELGLESKVKLQDGKFSTTSLSDGQKKRLALLVAYLEDRLVYVFDEWAADQDPAFKDVFYYKIIPSLKKMNKFVIVVSHDDRYFHAADKAVKMENGIINTVAVSNETDADINSLCISPPN